MRTSNPVLSDSALERAALQTGGDRTTTTTDAASTTGAVERFTVIGAIQRSAILLALVLAGGWLGWGMVNVVDGRADLPGWIIPVSLGLLAGAFVIVFKPDLAPVLAPAWAVGQGVLVGAISRAYEVTYDGIVLQAVLATLTTAFACLVAYRTGLIQATPRFRKTVVIATFGIMGLYLVNMAMYFFGGDGISLITDSGLTGILFSAFVVVIAAMNLILDFDLFERGEAEGWPAKMMWFAAFGLIITLVWLYLEMLRLLAKLRD